MTGPDVGRQALAPLRVPAFRWYFVASTVNLVGTTMAPVALAFAVLEVSNSPQALGYVLVANSVPLVVFLLLGGVVADRLPRVLLLRAGSVVLALTQGAVALLVLTDRAELWSLIVLEALNGATLALTFPALAALMPQLVPRELLQQANVLQSLSRGSLRVLGPTVAALLVVGVGPGWALLVDAVTWLLSAALLLKVPLRRASRAAVTDDGPPMSVVGDLREGWAFFRGTAWLWIVVAAFSVLNAIHAGAWFTLGPAQAKDTIGEKGWGLLLSAESVGLVLFTLVALRRRLERPLLLGMLGISSLGIPIVLLGVTDELPVLLVAAFVAGAGIELFGLGWTLAMQEHIDESMLSRAYSYDSLGSFVAIPIGQLGFGILGATYGNRDVMVVAGVVYIAVALLTLLSPSVRGLQRVAVADR